MKRYYRSGRKLFFIAVIISILLHSSCFAAAQKEDKASSFQYMKKINQIFDFVQQNYVEEIDPKILYEGAIKGMLDAIGDPYTLYLDTKAMRSLNDTTAGTFGGVGLTISKAMTSTPEKPAYVEVSSPVEDGPGAKAGIQSGDYIVAINDLPTPEMTMDEVLSLLRGEVGTPVTVSILRGTNMRFDVKLVRALIEVPTAKFGMIEGTSIGYVRLIEFTPETPKRLQNALDLFGQNNYTGMILDLRDNPGGLINSASDVADKFIDEGVIVSTKSRLAFENQEFKASRINTTVRKKIPIIVLINRGSASASEILSGALKDYHLAYLVGERTYGKGSVQQVIPLSNIDGMKITMARYYTPSDVNIDKIGIPPDLEVKNLQEFTEEEENLYVNLVKEDRISQIVEKNTDMDEEAIAKAAAELHKEFPVDERIIRKLIRNQVMRTKGSLLYDLDYDLQLNAALNILQSGEYGTLMASTKTLKELQDEVDLEAEGSRKEE